MKKIFVIMIVLCLLFTEFIALPISVSEHTNGADSAIRNSETRGSTLIVGSGQKYDKIQNAIDAANSGDTIRVYDGTYNEKITIDKTLTLIGNGSTTTTIKGDKTADVVIIQANWTNITGFTITGSRYADTFAGIHIYSSFNVITDSNCNNNYYGIYSFDYDVGKNDSFINCELNSNFYGIYTWGAYGNSIRDCTFKNNMNGIHLKYSNNAIIENCRINSGQGAGIEIRDSDNCQVLNSTSIKNSNGIYVRGSENVTIKNCICNWNKYNGLEFYGRNLNNNILNCTFFANRRSGIRFSHNEYYNRIENCTSHKNNYGIYIKDSSYNVVTKSSICFNNKTGIIINSSNENSITSNVFIKNNNWAVQLYKNSYYNSIYFNNFFKNNKNAKQSKDDGIRNTWNSSTKGNFWSDWTSPDKDSNGIVDKPYKISGAASVKDHYPLTTPIVIKTPQQAPVANASSSQNLIVNQTIAFDGSGSYDPNNDPLTYKWSFGDGSSTGWKSSSNVSHKYSKPGNFTITLMVSDGVLKDKDICIVHVTKSIKIPKSPVPMFRGIHNRIGISNSKTPKIGTINWSFETEYQVVSSPVYDDGKIFFGSDDYYIHCLDAKTGNEYWKYETSNIVRSTPTIANNRLFVGSHDYYMYCLNSQSGELIWKTQTGGSIDSSPILIADKLYFGSYDGKIYALNAINGEIQWIFKTNDEIWGSIAYWNNSLYFGSLNGKLYCLWVNNGTECWNFSVDKLGLQHGIYSTPAIVDDKVIFGSEDNFVYNINSTTGVLNWRFKTNGFVYSSAAINKGKVFVSNSEGNVGTEYREGYFYALPLKDPNSDGVITSSEVIWKYMTHDFDGGSSPSISKVSGKVVIGSNAGSPGDIGKVYCLDSSTGSEDWNFTVNGDILGSPLIALNKIYIGSSNGYMYCLNDNINKKNQPPIANAGPDQYVTISKMVTFNGSSSYDPDGDNLTYKWDFGDGTSSGWQENSIVMHTYQKPGFYIVTLTVSDEEFSHINNCTVIVYDKFFNYYTISIESITGGSLSLSDLKFKYYTKEDLVLYEKTILDAIPAALTIGVSKVYAIPSGSNAVSDSSTGNTITWSSTLTNYQNCTLTYLDADDDSKITKSDVIYIYKDINHDGFDEVTAGGNFIILDGKGNELARVKLPVDSNKSILINIDLSGNSVGIVDTDHDNIPDDWEELFDLNPNDPSDAHLDLDNDSLSNFDEYKKNTDPYDSDTDDDGYSDKVDAFPTNPEKYLKDETKEPDFKFGSMVILIVIIIILLLVILALSLLVLRNKHQYQDTQKPSTENEVYRKVMHDLVYDIQPNGEKLSNEELKSILETKFRNGEISKYTYEYIINNILNSDSNGAKVVMQNNISK